MANAPKTGERDYPLGHPAASDYKGEPYVPPRPPFADDYPADHPAAGGKNCKPEDQPDWAHQPTKEK